MLLEHGANLMNENIM